MSLYQYLLQLLKQINQFQQPAALVVQQFFKKNTSIGSKERHLLADVVFEYLRRHNSWQLVQQHFSHQEQLDFNLAQLVLAWLVSVKYTHFASLLPQNLTPQQQSKVAELVDLRQSLTMQQVNFELPAWWQQQILCQLSWAELAELANSLQQPLGLSLRVNTSKIKLKAALTKLAEQGISATKLAYSTIGLRLPNKTDLTKTSLFQQGFFEIQDEGSQLIALLTGAKRQQIVVDYCAGAGGKTLALAAMLNNSGRVYALDSSNARLAKLQPRLQRSGVTNVYSHALTANDQLLSHLTGKADVVLVDAPCSGSGTLRRFPDLKFRLKPTELAEYAQLQLAILTKAARLVKAGGRLLYSTCSIFAIENQQVAAKFSQTQPQFHALNVQKLLENLKIVPSEKLSTTLNAVSYLQLWPHTINSDGFFAAVWQKAVN